MKPLNRPQKIITGISIAIFLAILFFARGFLVSSIAFIQAPFVQVGTWVSSFGGNDADESRLSELEQQRNALAIDFAELQSLRDENAQLKAKLQYTERSNQEGISARVIARSISNLNTSFVIDRGSQDGIVIGSPVIVQNGVLIGKVTSLTNHTATVTHITDTSLRTAVALLNENRTIGVAEGTTGNLISLKFIPQDEAIEIDNLVVTSGLESHIPSGLILGIVTNVSGEQTDPFKTAIVEPLIDMTEVHLVSVLLGQIAL